MRIGLAILVALVFGAMLLFDTAAVVLLTADCVSGGCGVDPVWIATGAAGLVAAATLSSWWNRRRPTRRPTGRPTGRKGGGKAPARRTPAGKGGTPRKRRAK